MSLKDQMPFFSDPPPWYFRMMAILFGLVGVGWFILLAFIIFKGHEYWPILIFGPAIFLAAFVTRGLWQRARMKENERDTQERTPDA
jgi:hypothetical protein